MCRSSDPGLRTTVVEKPNMLIWRTYNATALTSLIKNHHIATQKNYKAKNVRKVFFAEPVELLFVSY